MVFVLLEKLLGRCSGTTVKTARWIIEAEVGFVLFGETFDNLPVLLPQRLDFWGKLIFDHANLAANSKLGSRVHAPAADMAKDPREGFPLRSVCLAGDS